jgi:hypothetical protein
MPSPNLILFLLASAITLFTPGCGKRAETPAPPRADTGSAATQPALESTPSASPDPGVNSPAGQPPPVVAGQPPPVPVVVANNGKMDEVLANLTQALRKYSFEHRQVPKTFAEVVAAGYVNPMPQPPAGKKFEIDRKAVQVILVKQ